MSIVHQGTERPVSRLNALIFDLDGTIADTEDVHRIAFNQAFAEQGLSWAWSPAEYARLLSISGGRERILYYAQRVLTPTALVTPTADLARKLHETKSALYGRMLAERDLPLRAGVLRLLREARSHGIRLAIASSTSLANVRAVFDRNLPGDWASWFDVLATRDEVEEKKPSPAVYRHVLGRTGWAPERCVAIEDTANGNRAALAAGLATVITTHAYTRNGDFTGASLVVDDLGEPDRPFEIMAGDAHGAGYVDIALLESIVSPVGAGVAGRAEVSRCAAASCARAAPARRATSTG